MKNDNKFIKKNKVKLIDYGVRPMALTLKAVVMKDDQVLLLKRSRKELTNRGKWDLPGGHIEVGENIEDALKREIKEETNLEVKIGPIIKVAEFNKEHEAFKKEKRGLRYIAYYQSGEVKLDKNEHSKFKWLNIDKAIKKLNSGDDFENEKKETLLRAKEYLEMKQAKDNWKRSVAEFENYKKRTTKSNEEFKKYANEALILEILPVLDNFEEATKHIPAEQQNEGWVTGIMFIQKQLKDVLANKNLNEIPTKVGDKIDESIHEVVKGKIKKGKGKVKKIIKKGYRLGERVARAVTVEAE